MRDELVSRFKKEDGAFTWEDVWFMQLNRLVISRNEGSMETIRDHMDSMENILAAKLDGRWEEATTKLMLYFQHEKIDDKKYCDTYIKELVRVLDRATSKKEDLTEYIENAVVVKNIVSKLKNHIGQNLMITGKPGSGKSWACIRLAEEIVKQTGGQFSPDHIVSTIEDFMKLYNDKNMLPPGSVVIFEEVGVNVNSKKAMSKLNTIFSDVFQTSRYKEVLVLLNAPSLSFLDKTPRTLLHWWLETVKLDKNKGLCHVKPHMVEVDQIVGELLFPYPRFNDGQRITRMLFTAPQKELREEYERRASTYKDSIGKRSADFFENNGFMGKELEYVNMRKGGMKQKDALEKLGKSRNWGTRIEKACKAKGIELADFRGKNLENVAKEPDA